MEEGSRVLRAGFLELIAGLSVLTFILLFWALSSGRILVEGLPHLGEILDPAVIRSLRFSVWQALLSGLITVMIATPLGYVNSTYDYPGRKLVEAFTTLPFTLPSSTVALAFLLLVNAGLMPRGWIPIVLAHAYFNFGMVAQMVSSSLSTVSERLEEAAEVLGADWFDRFRRLIAPLAIKGIAYGFLLTFALSFTSFAIPLLLGGPRYRTLEVEIYSLYKVLMNPNKASAVAILQLLVTMSLVLFMREREVSTLEVRRRKKSMLASVYPWLTATFSLLPLSYLLIRSLYDPMSGSLNLGEWAKLLSYDPTLGTHPLVPLVNTIVLSTESTLMVFLLSTLFALSSRMRKAILATTSLPLGTSSITLALGLFMLSRSMPRWILMILTYVFIALPFTLRAINAGISGLSPEVIEAAETLGMSRHDALIKVGLAVARPALMVGLFYSLALATSETTASYFLASTETQTLTVATLKYAGARRFQMASIMSVLVVFLTSLYLGLKWAVEARMKWLKSK